MKKWITMVFVLALVCVALLLGSSKAQAAVVEYGTCGDNLSWIFDDDGTLLILGNGEMKADDTGAMPWEAHKREITSVVIGDGVTSIAEKAFYDYPYMKSVTIGKSVTTIGASAFYNCAFKSVTLPESVQTIGEKAFYGSDIESITIPKSVRTIGNSAFSTCESLTSLTIQEGVTTIGDYAFASCISLSSPVDIPDSVTNIGRYGFSYCTQMPSVTIGDGLQELSMALFTGCSKLTSVDLGKGVTSIHVYAFTKCSGLTAITIPGNVKTIQYSVFDGCTSLASVTFKDQVSVYSDAFKNCTGLKAVYCSDIESWCSSYFNTAMSNPLYYAQNLYVNGELLQELEIGKDISNIGAYAFYNNTALKKLTITSHKTYISTGAFYGCTGLTQLQFKGDGQVYASDCFTGVTATAYYPNYDASWTEEMRQNYGGNLAWTTYERPYVVCEGTVLSSYNTMNEAIENQGNGYVRLNQDIREDFVLYWDLYIDLNGYDLCGTVSVEGGVVYGMDSTTEGYDGSQCGYFNCVDKKGNPVVPQMNFRSDVSGVFKRYLTICDENGYSFHRYYMSVTHMTLKPTTVGVGFKAVFYGDDKVIAALNQENALGYTLQLEGNNPVTVYMSADKIVSGKTITLRLDNFDVEKYGEELLYANLTLQLADGTVVESTKASATLRNLVEAVNDSYMNLSTAQLIAVKAMLEKFAVIKTWETENLL